jgi:hypothetical protein
MNLFQKNPFVSNTEQKQYNNDFSEKNKLEKIKMDMYKVKQIKPLETPKQEQKQITVKEKIDLLKNINK